MGDPFRLSVREALAISWPLAVLVRMCAVEPNQAFLCPQPQEPVVRLRDRVHSGLKQAFFLFPECGVCTASEFSPYQAQPTEWHMRREPQLF